MNTVQPVDPEVEMLAVTPRESPPAGAHPRPPALRFGEFTLDRVAGELSHRGVPVKIPPQPARVLQHLVENAGRLVSRRELQEVLWGDGRHVDFEQGLNYCIRQVREALGDSAETSRHLVTVPRRGYRFVAAVEELAGERRPRLRTARRGWTSALLGLVLLATAAVGVILRDDGESRPTTAAMRRVAVTPLVAPAPEDAAVARALYEELLVDLGQRGAGLELVAGEAVAPDLRLEGSLYRLGEELTLALRLTRVADGVAIWHASFRQPLAADDWLGWSKRAASDLVAAVTP